MVTRLVLALALLACRPSAREIRRALAAGDAGCTCPCACAPDAAAPDAPPDVEVDAASAPPDAPAPIDLASAWTRTTITAGAPTGLYRGADGVALDSEGCWSTAWEEGGIVTRACPIGDAWTTELVAQGLVGAEDAKAADMDGDGVIDVVVAGDSGASAYIVFRGATGNTTLTLAASQGHGHVMQVAIGDINGDTYPDIVFGTRVGSPAVVAWLQNPGPGFSRMSIWWTYHEISQAGWVMSLVPRDVDGDGDVDVIVSDRAKIGAADWSLYGARWMRSVGDTWIANPISAPAGSCSPYTSPTCTKTPGDEMFLRVAGNDVADCTSSAGNADSRIVIHHTADWLSWTHTVLPPVANVGHCQGVLVADVDQDGDDDLVVTAWKGNAYPVPAADAGKSGVYWLRNDGAGAYSRGEISGPVGGKFDNAEMIGRCIVTSEQLDPAGGLGVVRFCPPGVPP